MAGKWPFYSYSDGAGGSMGQPLKAFERPSDTWLLADGYFQHVGFWCGLTYRHPNTSASFAYADGHVESLGVSDIDGRSTSPRCQRNVTYSGGVVNTDVWDRRLSASTFP